MVPKLFALYWPWKYQICTFLWERNEKAHFENLPDGMQGWYILVMKIIKKKKKIGLDNQNFRKISSIGNNFNYYKTKIFLLYTLNLRLSWMGIKSWQRTEVELQSFKSVKAGGNPFKKAKRELWEDSDKSFSVKIPNKIWSHCSCIAHLGSSTSFPDL